MVSQGANRADNRCIAINRVGLSHLNDLAIKFESGPRNSADDPEQEAILTGNQPTSRMAASTIGYHYNESQIDA